MKTMIQQQTSMQLVAKKSGTFVAILTINLCLFLLLGTQVIYHFVTEHTFELPVSYKLKPVPPPPPKPPSSGGTVAKSLLDPTVTVSPPVVSLPSFITAPTTSAFKFANISTPLSATAMPTLSIPTGSGMGAGTSGGGVPQANPFGAALQDAGTPALVGYFYDLKQFAGDTPTPSGITMQGWRDVMDQLVADNLNEADLSKYFKSSEPRSTNGFSIPEQLSENAPAAFGLANKVQPNLWAIIYHGKASVPEAGRYRFVGFGDDLLYIKLNGSLVMDGGFQALTNYDNLHETYPYVWSEIGAEGLLRKGKWFDVEKGDIVDLDVLIGDWGGKCGYFLLLEKEGETYDKASDGVTPKLPLFQIGAKLPLPTGPETPPVSDSDVVWPAVSDQL